MTKGKYTRNEIEQQSKAWTETLAGFSRQENTLAKSLSGAEKKAWLVIGCGSTYYASLTAAALLRRLGIAAWAYPSSEMVYFSDMLTAGDMHLLAISRSGTTTETQWAVDHFRKRCPSGKVVSITTHPESPLGQASDLVLSAEAACERSVAQTRSFTSMFILSQCLAGLLAGDPGLAGRLEKLPPALDRLVERNGRLARQLGEDLSLQRFFFLGAGPYYGLACEAMLKTKEMTRSWAEAFHPLEFRHGPMSVVDDHSLVTCFVSDSEQEAEARVVHDMQKLGARILVLTDDASRTDWTGVETVVELQSGLDEWERGALYLPFIHWMDYHRTLARGLDPDQPTNLTAVVELE
jgi:glucosamine--fructose-6-phosphate aminotransferase (isomerizing)